MEGELFEHKPERVADYFVVVGLDPDVVPLQDEPFAFCDEVEIWQCNAFAEQCVRS